MSLHHPLRIGFGRADITPTESVPLGGYGNSSMRCSNNVLSPLCATCIAFSDFTGETVLLYTLDLVSASVHWPTRFCPAVSAATGIPEDHIFAAGTHSHSTPDLSSTAPVINRYVRFAQEQIVSAAKQALSDLGPTVAYGAAVQTSGLNFVRRYILQDGTPAGDNYGHFDRSPIAGHESEPDRTMQLLKFERPGAQDIILANFQTHPHRTGGIQKYDISSDIIGVMRNEMELRTGCRFAYFTGAAGNINPCSRIEEENIWADYLQHGKAMADAAIAAKDSYVPLNLGSPRVVWHTMILPTDHTQDIRLTQAKYIDDNFSASGDRPKWTAEGLKLGFNSVYHAAAVIEKSLLPASFDVPLAAFSLGGIGFALAPYEMFDSNGIYIKEKSPFSMTFVITCAYRQDTCYIPSALGFKNGGYSTDSCWFLPGTGETLAQELVNCLNKLREN